MSEILYVQIGKNVEIDKEEVYLGDIAKLSCHNTTVLSRNQVRKVLSLTGKPPGRYVISAMDIISGIQKREENVDVTHIGEANLILTYVTERHKGVLRSMGKTCLVCFITFVGAAFSIMTFNTDVNTSGLFFQLYRQFTGEISNGHTILELSYSIGIGMGVIFFFNHFGPKKLTADPTPMEVEMRLYEDDINKSIIEQKNRGEQR